MVTRAQIERLSERVEAVAAAGDKQRIVVVGPDETPEQALQRNGLPPLVSQLTGVPRSGIPGRGDKTSDREAARPYRGASRRRGSTMTIPAPSVCGAGPIEREERGAR